MPRGQWWHEGGNLQTAYRNQRAAIQRRQTGQPAVGYVEGTGRL